MKLSIGSDHAGFALKSTLVAYLKEKGYDIVDRGTHADSSVDYPPFAHRVAEDITRGESELGVLICGSANGVCMTANKHAGIRAALCWMPEIADLARKHNNANILCLPARYLSVEVALACMEVFLSTSFEGGRHENRVNQIDCI